VAQRLPSSRLNQLRKSGYPQPIIVVEYSEHKRAVNDIVHALPKGQGLGTFIWEPTQWGEPLFDHTGRALPALDLYPTLADEYRRRW
jgi:arabinogalactan endo-1,4-beta-galactosidase